MTAIESVDPVEFLRQQLAAGGSDVLRTMVATFANAFDVGLIFFGRRAVRPGGSRFPRR